MRHGYESKDDIMNQGLTMLSQSLLNPEATGGAADALSEPDSELTSDKVVERWMKITSAIVAKARLNAATEDDEKEQRERKGGRTVRRVSYVAAEQMGAKMERTG